MYTIGKLNDNEVLLNFGHIYPIFMIHTILIVIHTV